jgi:hypothetical protein
VLGIVSFVAIAAIAVYYFKYYQPAQSTNTPASGAKLAPSPPPVNGVISSKLIRRGWIYLRYILRTLI